MIELICMVLINMGGKEPDPFLMEGTRVSETKDMYIVDFSNDPDRDKLKGSYSSYLIDKFYCSPVNKRLIA